MDLEIRKFRDSIVSAINSFNLPLEVKRLQLAEIYREVVNQSERVIELQAKEKLNETDSKQDNNQ